LADNKPFPHTWCEEDAMRRRKKNRSFIGSSTELNGHDMVRLWVLRISLFLGGHQNLVGEQALLDDEQTSAIGMGHWLVRLMQGGE
jgi:hypothetical protein